MEIFMKISMRTASPYDIPGVCGKPFIRRDLTYAISPSYDISLAYAVSTSYAANLTQNVYRIPHVSCINLSKYSDILPIRHYNMIEGILFAEK